jgi:hypothetical protein
VIETGQRARVLAPPIARSWNVHVVDHVLRLVRYGLATFGRGPVALATACVGVRLPMRN